ncbi:MAG: ATP-binding domain-containing protein [Kurthia sp.]|nr:ATP-binding domain-containing protein [Candidatus Kurthia equi]
MKKEEASYLDKTLTSLQNTHQFLSTELHVQDHQFKELQQYLVDYKAELDKFEVYDYQQSMHMIDKNGFAKATQFQQVEKMLQSPYFGRFDFVYDGEDSSQAEPFYIGRFGHTSLDGETLIYDWRAPICNMYYEYEIGPASYEAMDRLFEGELIRKKQLKVENGELKFALDSSLTIQDEILQQTLHQQGSEKMKTIVNSIQREQNKIIRNESAYNMVIQGVAGSGKTAVALHRLAYFLYKFRDTLRAERIFILSPNKVFGDYISTVLPNLGEQPIRAFTMDELSAVLLPSTLKFTSFEEEIRQILQDPISDLAQRAKLKANGAFVYALDTYLETLNHSLLKNEDLTIAEHVFSKDYIQSRFHAYRKEPVLTRLSLMAEDFSAVLKAKYDGSGKIPSKNEIINRLKKRLNSTTALEIYQRFLTEYDIPYFSPTKKQIENNDVYPYLYVQNYFKGIKSYELVQHFVLDEMQDYTAIQMAVFSKVFACKRTIIGDFSQALLPYETISKEFFQTIFSNLAYVELTTTYRSSYEIADYTKKFLKNGELFAIARHGEKPEEYLYTSEQDMLEAIQIKANVLWETTAIICKNEQDIEKLKNQLALPFTLLDGTTKNFSKGLILTTIQYAKGLEFDHVIVPFVDGAHYTTSFDKGLLYIATSRAMHQLTILIDQANPSPLL